MNMFSTEQDRVHNMMRDKDLADRAGRKLVWDPLTKKIRATTPDSGGRMLEIEQSDMDHFGLWGGTVL
jgi:hypothetical protein